ncbi:beta strand repeat-containing protein, partial [Mannheimia sp. E30BD]|uniref:beta strand repeat-containing protein n=1 Tax=Mannheimia sp. E30BD TaxID=3278708 RepID=UPI00359D1CC5
MNHIYKVVFNKATGTFVAVAELAKSQGKSSTTTVGSAKPDIIGRAFRLSTLVMSLMTIQGAWAAIGVASPVLVNTDSLTIEPLMYSADMSNQVVAIGESSLAYKQGTEPPATGDPDKGGTAVGHSSKAQKSGSVALGGNADSQAVDAVAVGRQAQAKAKDSVAIGADVQTNGDNSQAIGTNGTKTNGESSIALGNGATTGQWTPARIGNSLVAGNAAATAAIAIGKDSTASNNNDIAIGQDAGKNLRPRGVDITNNTPDGTTIAFNGQSMPVATAEAIAKAFGNNRNQQAVNNLNPATGANISIGKSAGQNGMGRNNVAIGNNAGQNHYGEDSVTLGTGANNFLNKKIADGSTETITGTNMVRARQTVAIGNNAMTFGERSIAMGYSAKTESLKYTQNNQEKYTNPEAAIAIGQNATAQGYYSVAQGVGAKSQGSHDIAIGSGARTLIIENNGQGSSNIAMGQNALVGYGSRGSNMAIGSNAKVVGVGSNNSFAMGSNSTTMGNNLNVALGVVNTTFGDRSNAIGNRNYNAGGYDSAAVGAYNIINTGNANAVAVGSGNVVGSVYATAIGSGAMVFGANSGVFASAARNANVDDNTYNADTSLVDKMGSSSIVGGQDNFVIGNNNVVGNTSNNNMVLGNQIEIGADKATLTKVDLVRINVKDADGNYSTLALIKEGNGDQATYYEYDKNAKANGYKKVGAAAVISPVNGKRAEQTADGKTIIYATETSFVEFFPNFEGVKAIQNAVAIGQNAGVGADDTIAMGHDAQATGSTSLAIGTGAKATGIQSISIGTKNRVTANNAGAIGDPSFVEGADSYSYGNHNVISSSANNAFVIGNRNEMGGTATYNDDGSLPDNTTISSNLAGKSSVAIGNNNRITSNNTYVLGSGINTVDREPYGRGGLNGTIENSVYLGDDSHAKPGTATVNAAGEGSLKNDRLNSARPSTTSTGGTGAVNTATVNGITYGDFAGETPVGIVTVGTGGAERRIQNVAAGLIAKDSTDAINGSQLYATIRDGQWGLFANGTADSNKVGNVNWGDKVNFTSADGSVTIKPTKETTDGVSTLDFKVKVNVPSVETTTLSHIDGAVNAPADADKNKFVTAENIANAINNSGWKLDVSQSEGEAVGTGEELINPSDKVTIDAGKNISITQAGSRISIATADDVEFESVKTNSLEIPTDNGSSVKIDNNGVDVGGNVISNVNSGLNTKNVDTKPTGKGSEGTSE